MRVLVNDKLPVMAPQTISQILDRSYQRLISKFDTARLDAELLVAHELNLSRTQLYTWSDKELTEAEVFAIDALIDRRDKGEPIAYIVGHQEFWSLDFLVSPDTLIPRPETEHLVEMALDNIPLHVDLRILDLGAGSGAIAIAIAKERPNCQIVAVDKSSLALEIANKNVKKHAAENVCFKQSDWFEELANEKFDLIVCNPPYIDKEDAHLRCGDVMHEPKLALTPGNDGLSAIRQVVSQAKTYLNPNGLLMFEHGFDQAEKVRTLLAEAKYDNISSFKDLAGFERNTVGRN